MNFENLFRTVSMSLRFSQSKVLSLISVDAIHDLIWSRSLWSFLISFLRSASYFSWVKSQLWMPTTCLKCVQFTSLTFWLLLVALWTFCQISSNVSTPSVTFLRQRSISPANLEDRKQIENLLWENLLATVYSFLLSLYILFAFVAVMLQMSKANPANLSNVVFHYKFQAKTWIQMMEKWINSL